MACRRENDEFMGDGYQSITGWWFGTFFMFPSIGNVIIPTVTHSMIFQRGRAKNHQPDDDGREIRAGRILGLVSWPPADCMMSLALDS